MEPPHFTSDHVVSLLFSFILHGFSVFSSACSHLNSCPGNSYVTSCPTFLWCVSVHLFPYSPISFIFFWLTFLVRARVLSDFQDVHLPTASHVALYLFHVISSWMFSQLCTQSILSSSPSSLQEGMVINLQLYAIHLKCCTIYSFLPSIKDLGGFLLFPGHPSSASYYNATVFSLLFLRLYTVSCDPSAPSGKMEDLSLSV